MNELKRLVEILWSPFLPGIRNKKPVYFSFHKELLIRLFNTYGFTSDDPTKVVNRLAKQLLEVDGNSVFLRQQTLEPIYGKFSSVIVLVAQQVLVVEDMVKDRDGFSEDAYFPRLRNAISESLSPESHNPFVSSEDFLSVWRKLRDEIFDAGGNAQCITFYPGKSRKDLNRSYPMSQALLTLEDISILISRIGKNVFDLTDEELSNSVFRNKTGISIRGQRTLVIPFLHDRILRQIRSFKGYQIEEQDIKKASLAAEEYIVRVFKDEIDWGNEEFRLGFFNANFERINEDAVCKTHFRLKMRQRKCLVLIKTDLGEAWTTFGNLLEIKKGDSIVVLAQSEEIKFVLNLLRRYLGNSISSINWTPLPNVDGVLLAEIESAVSPELQMRVRDGLVLEGFQNTAGDGIEWVDGVCVDPRSNKYLGRFMPKYYSIKGRVFPLKGSVYVNSRVTTFDEFLLSIPSIKSDAKFLIELPTGQKGFITVATASVDSDTKTGYEIRENGKLAPIVSELPMGMDCVQGFYLDSINEHKGRAVQLKLIATLVKTFKQKWTRVSTEEATLIVELLSSAALSKQLYTLLKNRIQSRSELPADAIRYLKGDI